MLVFVGHLPDVSCLTKKGYYACVDCDTLFPIVGGEVMCNGHAINLCPWCRCDLKA